MTSANAPALPVPPPPSPEIYRLAVPNTESAPKIARDFVGLLLRRTAHSALADDARLCTSEVVTNVHRHTRTRRIRLDVTVGQLLVMVHVRDDTPFGLPVPGAGGAEQTHGRGLLLLDSLAVDWGWTIFGGCSPESKAVWFTLAESEQTA
ncbi:ATP-binding protein [Streptomyces sp. AK02-01A]|uniref:ATP-binding protein n=1 Tax=Streptomyces sp. AK02-01A TaxID=3028648 RepID=UPI0029ABF2D4|nr:ATP-binding protein [Streptomyces sp. AK02-01A]MDX3853246.1 ATP-binding protein [Streptomyces sp. AK02-01A]